ncbi:MAG: hypothetical protein VBE63_13300 [Lamprobacter sp.]|uniref:hypothetical protein n=1 Tax=Lamprobacter sp. TaxID=3100796 RepID=UPI002B25920A|nr:hypothetical protein [Lamprobacter sp.]MEA3640906.1 hypothetical protein [Lamprobacter sp.]
MAKPEIVNYPGMNAAIQWGLLSCGGAGSSVPGMYIRRTQTRNTATGERYFTHRLVRSERQGGCSPLASRQD